VINSLTWQLEQQAAALVASSDPEPILISAFEACNEHLRDMNAQGEPIAWASGACAIVTYVRDNKLWVAGVGDCQAILGSRRPDGDNGTMLVATMLSVPHRPDAPGERARIEAAGAWIRESYVDEIDGAVIGAKFYGAPPTAGGLASRGPGLSMSRALGDLNASALGLLATPDVVCHELVMPEDEYLVLASDGVWEFLDHAKVLSTVEHHVKAGKSLVDACKFIIALSANEWLKNEGDYRDDITVTVVSLAALSKACRPREE